MELSAGSVSAGLLTVSGVLVLVVSDRRRTGRWSLPVLWTAGLAVVTATVFWFIGEGPPWGVAAPGLVIWCATIATGGRPGVLVDPPPASAGTNDAPSRSQKRAQRLQSRRTWRYLLLVIVVAAAVAALAVAGLSGHLPWSP
ncbi:hypothetical protein ACPPVT_10785 [Angustibacter sp. McL0619]|uniref:hypothetical protein n=1 Tax=Angustibacter sp. McL0619 TaxID=3415676 RepID=UPI003CF0D24E